MNNVGQRDHFTLSIIHSLISRFDWLLARNKNKQKANACLIASALDKG
jgi:hypothetical protein